MDGLDALDGNARREVLPDRRADHQPDRGPPVPHHSGSTQWWTSAESTNPWTVSSWPRRAASRTGPGSRGQSSCCYTLTHAAALDTPPQSSPPWLFIKWWGGRGSKAHQFLQLALEADPGYHLASLSDEMICFRSAAVSCRSPAILHEQVSERECWTGRKPRSIKRVISKSCCTRP